MTLRADRARGRILQRGAELFAVDEVLSELFGLHADTAGNAGTAEPAEHTCLALLALAGTAAVGAAPHLVEQGVPRLLSAVYRKSGADEAGLDEALADGLGCGSTETLEAPGGW
jgi:hypothetical protein